MRILGVDPGLRITGFGVIEKTGSKLRYLTSGCVRSGEGDLAARLGGRINACSRPGQGSMFELCLPLLPQLSDQRGKRMLILDSDPVSAAQLSGYANTIGIQCETSLPHQDQNIPAAGHDYILIDDNFAGADGGITLAERAAKSAARSQIIFTTYDHGVDRRVTLSKYAGTILYKPFTAEMLHYALCRIQAMQRS